MNLHTIRTLASIWRRPPGSPAPTTAPRRPALTPAGTHLVRTLTPVIAAAIRSLARLFRPVA